MYVLKHPAFTSVHADSLQSRVDRVASRNVSHPCMAKAGVASLEFCHEFVDLVLEDLGVGTRQDLIPAIASQSIPIHAVHSGIEVFGSHKTADLVENLCALVESQIHCCLIPIGVDVSPTVMNAAQ